MMQKNNNNCNIIAMEQCLIPALAACLVSITLHAEKR